METGDGFANNTLTVYGTSGVLNVTFTGPGLSMNAFDLSTNGTNTFITHS